MEDDVSIPNYSSHVVPRSDGKGGGIVIYFKDCFRRLCKIVENVNDSIIIMKISKEMPFNDKVTYMFVNYFPPYNSTYYDRNDVGLICHT